MPNDTIIIQEQITQTIEVYADPIPAIELISPGTPGVKGDTGDPGDPGPVGPTGPAPAGQVWLSAAGMWPSTSQGASPNSKVESPANKVNVYVIDFAEAANPLYAEATFGMPVDWDGGSIVASFYWTLVSGATDHVVWGLQGRSIGQGEDLDQAWGAAQEVVGVGSGAPDQVLRSGPTPAITLGGTPSAGELAQLRVYRDPTNPSDDLAGTARLLGVMIGFGRA